MNSPKQRGGNFDFPQNVDAANQVVARLLGTRALKRWVQNGGKYLHHSFANGSLQRSVVTGVTFEACDFSDAAANGVIWTDNSFVDCLFSRSDMEFADMSRCRLVGPGDKASAPMIDGAGFNGTVLRDAQVQRVITRASSFAYADFTNAEITDCDLNGTFEGCLFERSRIKNSNFLNSNIEYSDFTAASFDNVTLGLGELPYLFGVDRTLIGHGLNVVAVNEESRTEKTLSEEEVAELASPLIAFYLERKAYFAACNLTFLFGSHTHLMPLFIDGIHSAWAMEDIRSLKLLCKLIYQVERRTGLFGATELRKLYDMITTSIGWSANPSLRNQFDIHDGQFRAYLLAANANTLQVHFQSLTHRPEEANAVAARVMGALQEICRVAEIAVEISGSQFHFNSYPRHIIEVRVVRDERRHTANSPHWIDRVIAACAMLFAGLAAVTPLLADKPAATPSTTVQQVIIDNHVEISPLIVPQSFVITKDGLPLTGWDGNRLIQHKMPTETPNRISHGA